jgi:hypothetical protein
VRTPLPTARGRLPGRPGSTTPWSSPTIP